MRKITYLLGLLAMFWQATCAYAQDAKYDASAWKITASSQIDEGNGSGFIEKAFDGNPQTYWHSNWSNDKTNPKWILIDTQTPVQINKIDYTPRQDGTNGSWFTYKVYASDKPFTGFTTPSVKQEDKTAVSNLTGQVTEGTLCAENETVEQKQAKKTITIANATAKQYYLLVITDAQGDGNGKHATAGEIEFFGPTKVATAEVTYNYTLNGEVKKTEVVTQTVGSDYKAPALNLAYVTTSFTPGKVQANNNVVTVTCTEELPFEKSTDLQTAKWYAVDMHSNQKPYFWQYTATDANISTTEKGWGTAHIVTMDDSFLWCFKGNVFDGFEIYNKVAGTNTLNGTAGNPKITADANHTKWTLHRGAIGTCFKAQGTEYMNHQGNSIAYWSGADHGSSCRFFKAADFCLTSLQDIQNIPTNAVGSYPDASSLNAQYVDALKNDPFNMEKAKTVAADINALPTTTINLEAGLYRIISANTAYMNVQKVRKAMYLKDNTIRWTTLSMSDAGQVFALENGATSGKFVVKNGNSESYMQGVTGALGTTNTSEITCESLGYGQYNIKFGNQTVHTNGHNGGNGKEGNLVNWGGGLNTASAWYIVKATDLEVALTTVVDAAYATAYLPFAVSAATGAEIYVGQKSADGNTLKATSVTAVPAKTGIILKGAAGVQKATLSIVPAANATAPLNNALTGTLLAKAYNNELVLGNNAGVIGFYGMNAGKQIGANKAFLEDAAQGMALSFDGEATGIESVMGTANENAPIFDLSGRRVVKTVKGGLYIQNGKKFIVR